MLRVLTISDYLLISILIHPVSDPLGKWDNKLQITICEAMKRRGLSSVDELVDLTKLSYSTVQRVLTGRTGFCFNERTVELLANALGLSPDQIIWPNGVSGLGRPPHTGRETQQRASIEASATCPTCNIELPKKLGAACDYCS